MAAPWFKLYPKEIFSKEETVSLSDEQFGKLVRLWARASENGSIPADAAGIANLLQGQSAKQIEKHLVWIREFFRPMEGNPSRLVSKRLLREQAAYEEKCEQLRKNGAKGGRPPKPDQKPDGLQDGNQIKNQSGTEVGSWKKEKELPPKPPKGGKRKRLVLEGEILEWFEKAWKNWPTVNSKNGSPVPRCSRFEAEQRFAAALGEGTSAEVLAYACGLYASDMDKLGQYAVAFTTFLGSKRIWVDYLERASTVATNRHIGEAV